MFLYTASILVEFCVIEQILRHLAPQVFYYLLAAVSLSKEMLFISITY